MRKEKGVVLVAYKKPSRKPRYLLLQRKKNWEGWELPKGRLEQEDYRHTAELELSEEAGIDEEMVEELEEMDHTVEWTYEDGDEEVKREYRAFLIKLSPDSVIDTDGNPHDEHGKGFFLKKEDAESLLTYDNNIELLSMADEKID